jgi:hypothetical protein
MGNFGTRMAFLSCPGLGQDGWAFLLLRPSVRRCGLLYQGGADLWTQWFPTSEAILIGAWELCLQRVLPGWDRAIIPSLKRVWAAYTGPVPSFSFSIKMKFSSLYHLTSAYHPKLLSHHVVQSQPLLLIPLCLYTTQSEWILVLL